MKKYYIADPFPYINHGITNYVESSIKILNDYGVDVSAFKNKSNRFNKESFAKDILTECQGAIVEIPDTHGMFSSGSDGVDLHVRLHAPILRLESLNQRNLSKERFSRELATINNAKFISSPTFSNFSAYKNYGLGEKDNIEIFPNPLFFDNSIQAIEKDIDLVFVCRFERLKGIDLFAQLLCHLPNDIKVVVIGVKEENFSYFSNFNFSCQLELVGWISNNEKNEYIARSKICLMLSRFESFSMVVAEGLLHGCHVVTWNIAGAAEAFAEAPVKFVKPFDVRLLAASVLDLLDSDYPCRDNIIEFVNNNNNKYVNGVKNIIANSSDRKIFISNEIIPSNYIPLEKNIRKVVEQVTLHYQERRNFTVAGLCMNSESAENMWGSLFDGRLFSDYSIFSRKPLGTYYKKGFSRKFKINPDKYKVIDWYKFPDELANELADKSFDTLLVFNGNTKQYRNLISRVYDKVNNTPVFTELGWFPQNDHIYFDIAGANARSSLRNFSFEELIGRLDEEKICSQNFKNSGQVLLALQLPGDTTLMKESFPLALSNQDFIKHIRTSLSEEIKIVIRKHPMDASEYSLDKMRNIYFSDEENFSDDLSKSDSLIAVNSTVVLEALDYDVNIYTFGFGVFSGKNITIDCHKGNLSELWLDAISFDVTRRKKFIQYLNSRQLNVVEFFEKGFSKEFSEALYPIFLSIIKNESEKKLGVKGGKPWGYINKIPLKKPLSIEERLKFLEKEIGILKKYSVSYNIPRSIKYDTKSASKKNWKRKIRKLFNNPTLFFRDYFDKRMR
ncbi:glycosyltransferase [Comamonas sp. 17RB]|uniref:glycosyltransferase n=1 Tax=Comamonas sp. 17RB TaxID=3047025 RepID=UPI0024B66D96|nr:glycosyltransferase [Comamonas sp. 17RB]MDI9855074.1 glycosyltransferase [Comamonas sp. 17RB]